MNGTLDQKGDQVETRSGEADSARHTRIKLDWDTTSFAELQIEFDYNPHGDEYLNDPVKDTYFFRSSKGAGFVKNRITDKDSPYKWEYLITLERSTRLVDENAMGTVMRYAGSTVEKIVFRMLSPYE
jgi:hypothetical protein